MVATTSGLVQAACSGRAVPADIRLHPDHVALGDEAAHAAQRVDGGAGQPAGFFWRCFRER